MRDHARHHGLQAAKSAMQLVYHLAILVAACIGLLALGARSLARGLQDRSVRSKSLAKPEDAPRRVMHVHIHLNMQGKDQ